AFWIGIPLEAVMLKISDGVRKVAVLTIPFFVLAGAIMAEGGMARRLVAFADVLVGLTRLRGGLSIVNVLATTFLSGISGSAVADTSAIGSALFMAGVFPGLLLGFSLIILCLVIVYRNGHPRGQTVPAKDAVRIVIDAAWG